MTKEDKGGGEEELPPILKAAKADNVKEVKWLLAARADPSEKHGPSGWNALHYAAGHNAVGAIKALVEANANVESAADDGETPIFLAAQQGAEASIRTLHELGANISALSSEGETPLHCAVQHIGSKELNHIDALLELKADPNQCDGDGNNAVAVANVYTNRGKDIQELLAKHGHSMPAEAPINHLDATLNHVCYRGQKEGVQQLLDMSPDSAAAAQRALTAGASGGHVDVVKMLVAAKADVSKPSVAPNDTESFALSAAVEEGTVQMVKYLLSQRANPNAPSNIEGGTVLMAASGRGTSEAVRLLLAARADANHKAANGLTPLMLGAQYGGPDVCRQLLDSSAELEAKNREGQTARDIAVGANSSEVMKLFERLSKVQARKAKAAAAPTGPKEEDTRDLEALLRKLGETSGGSASAKSKPKKKKAEDDEIAEADAKPKAKGKAAAKAKATEAKQEAEAAPAKTPKQQREALKKRLKELQKQRAAIEAEEAEIHRQLAEL